MLEADAKIYREAVIASLGANFRFGQHMDAKTLTGHTMRYLRGKGNPVVVYKLAKEYLDNGCNFREGK
jgi:hypothetical protein